MFEFQAHQSIWRSHIGTTVYIVGAKEIPDAIPGTTKSGNELF